MNIYCADSARTAAPEYADQLRANQQLDYALFAPVDSAEKLSSARLYARGKVLTRTQLEALRRQFSGAAKRAAGRPGERKRNIYGLSPDEERAVNRAQEGHPVLGPPRQLDWEEVKAAGQIARGVYDFAGVLLYVNGTEEKVEETHLQRLQALKKGSLYVWYRTKFFLERGDAVIRAIVDHLPAVLEEAERERQEAARQERRKLPKDWAKIGLKEPLSAYCVRSPLQEYTEEEREQVRVLYEESLSRLAQTLDPARYKSAKKLRALEVRQQRQMVEETIGKILLFGDLMTDFLTQVSTPAYLVAQAFKTGVLGVEVATAMGFAKREVVDLGMAAVFQDLGMGQLEPLLRKTTPLAPAELQEVRRHPLYGAQLLEKSEGLSPVVAQLVSQSHERPNGSGYPSGLAGSQIHPLARVLTAASIYTAMISPRPYRPALDPYTAIITLLFNSYHNSLDRQVVKALLDVLSVCPIGMFVKLSTGEIAKVKSANKERYTRPVVTVLCGANREKLAAPRVLDLAESDREIAAIASRDEIPGF